ncbi:hypothetical protein A6723_024290 [Pseudomonas sp. AU11447]|uniref:hypothetical protein n=1 Tax=unclassified Pseudomonas TaxID=196821 RepID=UPI0006D484A2|nr:MULTISPECIES: hypothetical protein [unclassified Pseudomonas]OBY91179.1 hypothetical protein A6723_024290 [Pseudomonas sp. AU11447]
MSAFYDRMAATALRLISRFGSEQTLRDVTAGVYDDVSGTWTTPPTDISQPAQLLLLDYTLQESGQQYAEGSEIRQGDKKIIIAARGLAWAPALTTRIDVDGVLWQVVNVKEANPAGTPLVYFCQGRK